MGPKIANAKIEKKDCHLWLVERSLRFFVGRTDAEAEIPIFWPPDVKNWLIGRLWCWARLKAGGEGDDRKWDGWMASPTRWTWVWANSWTWWWTGRPGMLQSMGLQRVGHNWVTELNWTVLSHVWLFATLWTIAHLAPLSMEFLYCNIIKIAFKKFCCPAFTYPINGNKK